MLITL